MFDLGLSKLALIGVVALVVVGPEKLPRIARMAGSLLGRLQRAINEVKTEVSREMAFEDLHKLRDEVQDATRQVKNSMPSGYASTAENTDGHGSSSPFDDEQEQRLAKARLFRRNKTARASLAALISQKMGRRITAGGRAVKKRSHSFSVRSCR